MIKTIGNAPELAEVLPLPKATKSLRGFWDSPETLARYVETLKEDDAWTASGWNDDENRGTRSMPEALKIARDGWHEGAVKVAKLRDRINASNPTGPRIVRYDIAGAYPSVARAIAGNPMNMRRVDTAKLRRRPVITFVSNMSAHWGITAETLMNRAAVVAALIDAAEAAGYAAQIIGMAASGESHVSWSFGCTLKESTQPVDIARLAFGLGHPSMFRRFGFAMCQSDRMIQPLGAGLGSPFHASPDQTRELATRGVYVLPGINGNENNFKDEKAAETRGLISMRQALENLNCPAFPKPIDVAA